MQSIFVRNVPKKFDSFLGKKYLSCYKIRELLPFMHIISHILLLFIVSGELYCFCFLGFLFFLKKK